MECKQVSRSSAFHRQRRPYDGSHMSRQSHRRSLEAEGRSAHWLYDECEFIEFLLSDSEHTLRLLNLEFP
jgi:hypothetical protein